MSTSFNNQWVLVRARSRRRERAVMAGTLGQPANPQERVTPERRRLHAPRKRPRWVDRDT
jgi:hypothetical protein